MNSVPSALLTRVEEARQAILARCPNFPKIVLVLGSGLAKLTEELELETRLTFSEIPHVKAATVSGHVGALSIGKLGGVRIACLSGRLHFYEGHSLADVVLPFRAMARAGAEVFILTNAAGGVDETIVVPALMLIKDHINLMGANPLKGPNEPSFGPRFPDLSHVYDVALRDIFRKVAADLKAPLREGVYTALQGPTYETPAEVRMVRILGGDAVGMSTVPEAIALRHMGKRVAAVSCITNLAAGVGPGELSHDEVLENGARAYASFASLMKEAVKRIGALHG